MATETEITIKMTSDGNQKKLHYEFDLRSTHHEIMLALEMAKIDLTQMMVKHMKRKFPDGLNSKEMKEYIKSAKIGEVIDDFLQIKKEEPIDTQS